MATRRLFDGATIEIGQVPIQAPQSIGTIIWKNIAGVWKQTTAFINKGPWKQLTPFINVNNTWK